MLATRVETARDRGQRTIKFDCSRREGENDLYGASNRDCDLIRRHVRMQMRASVSVMGWSRLLWGRATAMLAHTIQLSTSSVRCLSLSLSLSLDAQRGMWKALLDANIPTLPRSIRLTDSLTERGRSHRAAYSCGRRVIHSLSPSVRARGCVVFFCSVSASPFVSCLFRLSAELSTCLLVNGLSIR